MLSTGGRKLFAAKIKLYNLLQTTVGTQQHGRRRPVTVTGSSGWRYVGFDIATVYFVLGPLWASPASLSGPLMSLRLLLTILRCLPQYSSELHMGHRGERAQTAIYFYTNFPL